ncbi:flagellar hook-associated protein FlgK [Desulfopila sp. IMCC35006]|uniref:flagellar hook-associated protein FlgK n=1 Tax=Desulfopila sp. IMCC35006 TaxID=2569542 RepID=UPI0010ABC94E|nr:flagellar hook-associated protein FlgK [Desulfopila sp. IMCC35006]TKB25824.1 flagellar hook-associated protein FlgK [Desulfopila sp. IMCC35006]
MAGLFNALNSARTSLEVSQKSIEITGNNIANVNTEGYSRQKANYETYPAMNFGDFFIGQGVKISDVSRDHDVFIDAQIKQKAIDFGLQDASTRPLSELESVFNITEDNISTDIDNFFDSLQELSADPSDLVQRNNVILQGEVLATSFNNTMNQLNSIKENLNETILSKLDAVNAQINEIADLNDRIYSIEIHGQTANSARDQRDMLAKSLAQTLGAQSYENDNGMLSVALPGGMPLVQGNMAMTITADESGADLTLKLKAGGVTRDLTLKNMGGEFKGLMDIRDNFIPELTADMDKLAYELSTQVNLQHQAGGGLDSSTGNLFFSIPPNYVASPPGPAPTATEYAGAARQMSVVITDPAKIAAGAAATTSASGTVAPGDNSNALTLANIADTYLIGGVDNFNSLYGKVAAKVGVESNQNQLSLKGAEDALDQLENFRDGLVGVSLEEEMISLIQYQRGFESSAKFLSTVDEMMTTILDIKR